VFPPVVPNDRSYRVAAFWVPEDLIFIFLFQLLFIMALSSLPGGVGVREEDCSKKGYVYIFYFLQNVSVKVDYIMFITGFGRK
jgi:hypothetical protein